MTHFAQTIPIFTHGEIGSSPHNHRGVNASKSSYCHKEAE